MSDSGGLFAPLTRAELDTLNEKLESAHARSQAALAKCPLTSEIVYGHAGVAADCLGAWMDGLDESIWRMWHGEKIPA